MKRAKTVGCLAVLAGVLVAGPARAAVPDPRFVSSHVQSGGSIPVATAIGDVTGDGWPDLIVANGEGGTSATDDRVFVFAQDAADHTLAADPFFVTPSAASSSYRVAVGDLNHDGKGDLAVGIPGVGIDVSYGTGSGLPSTPDLSISAPVEDLAVGDLNGDGRDDLLTTEAATPDDVVLRTQLPLGGFTPGTVVAHDVPVTGLSLGDVNGDDSIDFALDGSYNAPKAPAVYLQDALLHTFSARDVTLPTDVTRLFLADVNHDGSSDVVVAKVGGGLGWAISAGDGTFADLASVPGPGFTAEEVGDLNGDGTDDVATLSSDGNLRIYVQQDGGGGLGAPCAFPAVAASGTDAATSIGDLTGDGGAEIAAADGGGDLGAATVFRQLTGTETMPTSLDLAPSASSLLFGTPVTLSGTLSNPGGGCVPSGPVSIHRMGPGGGTSVVDTVPLEPDLSFSSTVTPQSGGTNTYWATWASDGSHAAATSPNVEVSVTKLVTGLGLTVSDHSIVYGHAVTLRARLWGAVGSPSVTFYRVVDGVQTAIDRVPVDADGRADLRIFPVRNASYRARFLGNAGLLRSSSVKRSVSVQVVVEGAMVNPDARDGDTAVYDCCKAFYRFVVKPKHPGGTVVVAVQYRTGGTWHKLPSVIDTFLLGKDGTDTIFLRVAGGKGYTFRVRSYFASDGDHVGAWSSSVRFRFR